MEISWLFSKLGMLIGFLVLVSVMYKAMEVYDVHTAQAECSELAQRVADTISSHTKISSQMIKAYGGVYKTRLALPPTIHGESYSIKISFKEGVEIYFPQGYRGRRVVGTATIPVSAIPRVEENKYLVVNNMYMVEGANTPTDFKDDVYVWPLEAGIEPESPAENMVFLTLEFDTPSDWVAFKLESSGDELVHPKNEAVYDETSWNHGVKLYEATQNEDGTWNCKSRRKTQILALIKENGDKTIKIGTGEGSGCSKGGEDKLRVYFFNGSEEEKVSEGIIGCRYGCEGGFQVHTIELPDYRPPEKLVTTPTWLEVAKTRNLVIITLA